MALAKQAGVSEPTIYKIESGVHCPNESTVELLTFALGVDVARLHLPRGMTHLGKPAQSAGRFGKSVSQKHGSICPECFTERSLTGDCVCTM